MTSGAHTLLHVKALVQMKLLPFWEIVTVMIKKIRSRHLIDRLHSNKIHARIFLWFSGWQVGPFY